jgi:hypothetical protein
MLTAITVVRILRAHRVSAFIADPAIPIIQRHIWAVRAVGIQDAPDHSEKITYSAFFKSDSNRSMTISFTKFIAADVRVGNPIICRGRMRFDRNYKVRAAIVQLFELFQLQLNFKRTQVDILEGDWLCNNRYGVFGGIEFDVPEFFLEPIQFIEE